jgi:drug/metabolite transporter (DMT)-like permease
MAGWGYLFFAEIPLLTTWFGAFLIIGATFFITLRESQLAAERRRALAAVSATSQEL